MKRKYTFILNKTKEIIANGKKIELNGFWESYGDKKGGFPFFSYKSERLTLKKQKRFFYPKESSDI